DQRDEALVSGDEISAAREREHAAAHDVAVGVGRAEAKERRPAADVVPTEFARDNADVLGLLEDPVVDRLLADAFVRGGEARAIAPARHDFVDGACDLSKVSSERVADRFDFPDEDPAVPEIPSALDELLGPDAVGLLGEAAHPMRARRNLLATLD